MINPIQKKTISQLRCKGTTFFETCNRLSEKNKKNFSLYFIR